MFGSSATAESRRAAPVTLRRVPEWSASQRLAGERETLGLYLTGHPIAPFEAGPALFCFRPHRRVSR